MHILSFFTWEIYLYSYNNIPIKAKELNHFKKYNMLFIKENYIRLKQLKIYFANYKKIKVGVYKTEVQINL